MSANEIANHIEAACWLRFGPQADPLIDPPPLYFRSQNGFIDRIGIFDLANPLAFPACMLELDRYYTRGETAVFAFVPTTLDGDATAEGLRPDASTGVAPITPVVFPIDSRILYGEIPATEANVIAGAEAFNALLVAPFGVEPGGEAPLVPSFYDLCIQVLRIPRGTMGPDTVTYKVIIPVI